MDQNAVITPEIRKKIYGQLAEAMVKAMENDEITEDDAADSADIILKRLDAVQTGAELMALLGDLSTRWNMYVSVFQDAKREELLQKVTVELNEMSQPTH